MALQKPTLAIFTGGKTLGTVITEQHQVNVKFTEFNIPFTDETGNQAINWKGKVRTILLQGFHDGTGFDGADDNAKLADFIYEMEQWVKGLDSNKEATNVQGAIVFTSSFGSIGGDFAWSVKAFDWTWSRSFSDPFRINYSLLLKVV